MPPPSRAKARTGKTAAVRDRPVTPESRPRSGLAPNGARLCRRRDPTLPASLAATHRASPVRAHPASAASTVFASAVRACPCLGCEHRLCPGCEPRQLPRLRATADASLSARPLFLDCVRPPCALAGTRRLGAAAIPFALAVVGFFIAAMLLGRNAKDEPQPALIERSSFTVQLPAGWGETKVVQAGGIELSAPVAAAPLGEGGAGLVVARVPDIVTLDRRFRGELGSPGQAHRGPARSPRGLALRRPARKAGRRRHRATWRRRPGIRCSSSATPRALTPARGWRSARTSRPGSPCGVNGRRRSLP